MYFSLHLVLFKILAKNICVVSYVHFPILEVFVCHLIRNIVSIYKTMDHIFTLSRRDFPSIALDIRYTSLDLQDFHLTFISRNFFVMILIMFNLYLLDCHYFILCTF